MTGGRFRIQLEDGKIKTVRVEAALELAYAGLVGAAQQDLAANPERLDAAIRLVVFGCCWLEANVNDYLKQILTRSLPPRVFPLLWKATERRPFTDKLSALAGYRAVQDPQELPELLKKIGGVFVVRNRLVHFKEEPLAIAADLELDDFVDKLSEFPEAELLTQLRQPTIAAHAASISCTRDWLNAVYLELRRPETIGLNLNCRAKHARRPKA